jgi:hypothetical protein
MRASIPSNAEQIDLRKPFEHEIISLFCRSGPDWKMPALEFRADSVSGSRIVMKARTFDFEGDGETAGAPDALMQKAVEYHALCASFGQGWKKCLLTLKLGGQGNVVGVTWNFSY